MKFGKLTDGRLHLCPFRGADGQGRLHTNLPRYYEHAADRDGWLEVVETEPPEGDYEPIYTVVNGQIVQSWQAVEAETDDPDAAWREMIEECLLELSEAVYA